jgi:hypothetical protein
MRTVTALGWPDEGKANPIRISTTDRTMNKPIHRVKRLDKYLFMTLKVSLAANLVNSTPGSCFGAG